MLLYIAIYSIGRTMLDLFGNCQEFKICFRSLCKRKVGCFFIAKLDTSRNGASWLFYIQTLKHISLLITSKIILCWLLTLFFKAIELVDIIAKAAVIWNQSHNVHYI